MLIGFVRNYIYITQNTNSEDFKMSVLHIIIMSM